MLSLLLLPPHLAHGLWVSCAGGEVSVQIQSAVQATPAVVARGSVGQAGRHQGHTLGGWGTRGVGAVG